MALAGVLRMRGGSSAWTRAQASAEAHLVGLAASATDFLPARVRYGHLRAIVGLLLGPSQLPVLGPPDGGPLRVTLPAPITMPTTRVTLVTGVLDVGGLENVVAMLAAGLPCEGMATSVLCAGGGATFDALRAAGIDVTIARTREAATAQLRLLDPDVVETHNAPHHLMAAVRGHGAPWVDVIHNMEIHRSRDGWRRVGASGASRWIAVSDPVREYHLAHLPPGPHPEVVVVANATPAGTGSPDPPARSEARAALGAVAGWRDAADDVVVASLARYDPQKNIPGLVSTFARAIDARPQLRLVVAGPPADRLEVTRADAIRRASGHPDHIALLGPSSSSLLLAAADAFVLDSYFEGGPLVAIEAARAGVPVILSDAGIARELLRDGTRGMLVANPADATEKRAVRIARRHPGTQRNAEALRVALVELADRMPEWRDARSALSTSAAELFPMEAMARGHAHWLREALRVGAPDEW